MTSFGSLNSALSFSWSRPILPGVLMNARATSLWGFNSFSKPGHQYFEACSEGRFLILAPWPHENQRIPLTRQMCLQLNTMTAEICGV